MSLFAPLALSLPLALSPYTGGSIHARVAQRVGPEATVPAPAPAPAPDTTDATDAAAADNGWGEPSTEPAPGTEAVPTAEAPPGDASAPLPVLPTPPPPGASTGLVKQPAPPPMGNTGIGLIVAAGAVGGVAIVSGVGRMVIISKSCATTTGLVSDTEGSIGSCLRSAGSFIGLTVLEWTANAASYGLAPAAGVTRARYDGSNYMFSGRPDHNGAMLAGIGGGLLGLGVLTKVGLWATLTSRFTCNADAEYGKCVRRRFTAYFGAQQLGSSAIAAGAGLLAYGIVYRKDRAAKERLYFRPEQVRLGPSFSRQFTGLSLSGRF